MNAAVIQAAGAVVWRKEKKKLKILLIHRPRRNDTSLPKGKLDPGEAAPEAAVREILEETGYRVHLGPPVDTVEYLTDIGPKVVNYWSAEVKDDDFKRNKFLPNEEVSEIEWVSPKKAIRKLTYSRDKDVLRKFRRLVKFGLLNSFSVTLLRHGKAVSFSNWDGSDKARPLEDKGHKQAKKIVATIRSFGPNRIYTSTATRCESTVAPLALATGLKVKSKDYLWQDFTEEALREIERFTRDRAAEGKSIVVCSHAPVIPLVLNGLGIALDVPLSAEVIRASHLAPGSFSVFHFVKMKKRTGILAVESFV